jgi:hypothetical protein
MIRNIPTPEESIPTPQALEQERVEYVLAQERLQTLNPEERLKLQLSEGLRKHIVENGYSTTESVTIELNWNNLKAAGGPDAINDALQGSGWQVAEYREGSGDRDVHNLHWAATSVVLERTPDA